MSAEIQNLDWLSKRQGLITASDITFILKNFGKDLPEALANALSEINTYERSLYQIYNEKKIPLAQYV